MLHPLQDKLSTIDGRYQKSVVKNIEILLSVLLVSRTVNLNKLKDDLPIVLNNSKLQANSCYKRLLRCVEVSAKSCLWLDILRWAVSFIWVEVSGLYLDATEWKFGSYPIHVLVLSGDFHGIAVPIYFRVYKHKGVLSESERIKFMKKAMRYYDLRGKLLIADGEFIGDEWFKYLDSKGVKLLIRLRKKQYKSLINIKQSGEDRYEKLRQKALKKGYAKALIEIDGTTFRIEFWRNDNPRDAKEHPVIFLITNMLEEDKIGEKYAQRWRIEYCFKHLKTNGFNIEDIGFKKIHKLQFLIAMVIVVYILACCKGIIADKKDNAKSKWKKYKSGRIARAVSIFRMGLTLLKATVYNIHKLRKFIFQLIRDINPKMQFVQ